ncbi:MAG: hypothetical protein H0U65_06785 [Rubrobacter sp.]|jgi:hypothetical protein|nr:hypothetical protein [Rubrobacter sp.]
MTFEDAALTRLRRYRGEADGSLENLRRAEGAARKFSERLFEGLEYTSSLAEEAGFEMEVSRGEASISIRAAAGAGESAEATFAAVPGAAAETDEDLMHEELSRYSLDPSGYTGRILGWTPEAGEGPCQIFAVYRDGTWKTKGLFVAKARGKVDDTDEITNGFCLRILGRLIDLAALTGGAGRKWAEGEYTLRNLEEGRAFPTEPRFPR